MADLTVIILTYNEAIHLARAINSIAAIAKKVIVVDSHSTDETVTIALSSGAQVLQNKFVNQAKQFQWALDNSEIDTEWIMRLDADEVVEPNLAAEINESLPRLSGDVTGVSLKRKTIFLGRWIRHGGRYPLTLLRIWRKGKARIEDRWMDEHILLLNGRAVTLEGGFADDNLNDLTFFTDKHNKYATREAISVVGEIIGLSENSNVLQSPSRPGQAARKRLLKDAIYNRIPYEFSSLAYFLYRYIFRLGFLDGREGFAYHFLQGYWYRFLVGCKIREFERAISGTLEPQEKLKIISRLTGYELRRLENSCDANPSSTSRIDGLT